MLLKTVWRALTLRVLPQNIVLVGLVDYDTTRENSDSPEANAAVDKVLL